MLSGSIQFSIPFQFIYIYIYISCIYQNNVFKQLLCNVKDNYTNTLFISFFAFRFVISHIAIESTFAIDSVGESCPVCHSVAMWSHFQYYHLTYGYRNRHSRQIQLVNPVMFVIQ